MSELKNAKLCQTNLRWHLLLGVSTAVLVASFSMSSTVALADDDDRPTVWLELRGQLEWMDTSQQDFAPPFTAKIPNTFFSPLDVQKPLRPAFGGEGSATFEPHDSDWVFSASVQFGRSDEAKQKHQQTPNALVHVHSKIPPPPPIKTLYPGKYVVNTGYAFYPSGHVKFEDATSQRSETHAVLDFQVGKDVGLGIFGSRGSSTLQAGVRFAQFTSKSSVTLRAEPDVHYPTKPISSFAALRAFKYYDPQHMHDFAGTLNSQRSFNGIGPSVSWHGSTPFAGDASHGELAFDWGLNGAILFGKQKARGHHQSTVRSYYGTHFIRGGLGIGGASIHPGRFFPSAQHYDVVAFTHYSHNAENFSRSRSVVVPNLGGTAGVSVRYSNAKVSFGYRADFFLGAMDGGINSARSETVGFHGPFAAISIGLP